MMNGYFRTIAGVLMAMSSSMAATGAAAFTGPAPDAPDPLRDLTAPSPPWNIESAEQEWPSSIPAAKVVADVCASVDVAALEGDALVDSLRTTSENCLGQDLYLSNNPSIRDDLPTIFSDRNMQSVFAAIERLSVTYDGTNGTGMLQLWFFVRIGYNYHRFFPEESGVGPFDLATDEAYVAASDAFAASDHFNAPNDVAARILRHYFQTAFSAGMRQHHLAPVKQVLSGFTPERAVTLDHAWATQPWSFITVLLRVYGAFRDQDQGILANQEFMDALANDPEFVEVMLQVTRYDFFFFLEESDSPSSRLHLLETAIQILVRLTRFDSLREAAIAALASVLSDHERLSSPFLVAAQGIEEHVNCASLNICRDVLEEEILARAVPNSYRFDDGALLFQTSLDPEVVRPWYQAIKEVRAQFHRLVETDDAVRNDRGVFTARVYGTREEYIAFEAYLSRADTRGIHSGGFYSLGTMHTFFKDRSAGYSGHDTERTVRHEYVHYLADRFGLGSLGGPWFDEGLAEFLAGSTQAEGMLIYRNSMDQIAANYNSQNSRHRLDPAGIFQSSYGGEGFESGLFYYYADLFFHFMHQQRRTELLELLDLVRSGDRAAYDALIAAWTEDTQVAADYDAFLDEQVASRDQLGEFSAQSIDPAALTSDSAAEIEAALQRINGHLGMDCQNQATEPDPRFECGGSLQAESQFTGDRGAINEHLNSLLDRSITAAVEDGRINNFGYMTCYFTDVAGSPPVADLRCEGPLRPLGLAQAQVDLWASLFSDGDDFNLHVGERHLLAAYLDFSAESASNVTMTWSSSLPLAAVNPLSSVPCDVVEVTERRGKIACGQVYKRAGETPLRVTIYFIPLEDGDLEISVEFSSEEPEIAPADNVASIQLTITQQPQHIATLPGHTHYVQTVAFSPDSTTLASGSWDGTARLWDVEEETQSNSFQGDQPVLSVAFSPDGRTLAAGLGDGAIELWNVETEAKTATFEGGRRVLSVAFSHDGKLLAAGLEGGTLELFDLETETSTSFSWLADRVKSVAFSPDGSTLAAGLGNSEFEPDHATIKLLKVGTESDIVTLSGHTDYINSVAFSPDGTTLASGSADGTVRLWDVESATPTASLDLNFQVHSVAISPVGGILAAGLEDNSIWIYDLETGRELASLVGHVSRPRSLAFSLDGTILASGGSWYMPVRLWNVSEWTIPGPVTLDKISGDGQQELTGAQLAGPFVVEVRDRRGNALEGAEVTFSVTAGDGSLSVETGTTDENGRVSTALTLGLKPGTNTVTAMVSDLEPVVFTAVGVVIPRTLDKISGDDQEGLAGAALAQPLVVSVLDQNGLPYIGAAVTFAVTSGDGTLSAAGCHHRFQRPRCHYPDSWARFGD